MRSPAEYYIKYLLSDPQRSITEVFDEMSKIDLPVDMDYLEGLKRSLRFPRNYSPLDKTHKPSRNFLKKERIWGLWHPDVLVVEAVKIYKFAGIRDIVCTSLLNGQPAEAISSLVKQTHGISIMPDSVREFQHYFWNTGLLTTDELSSLFMDDNSGYKVNYLAALRAPKNHASGDHLVKYKMGIMPHDLDTLTMLTTVLEKSYFNICDTDSFAQGRNKSEMFKNYAGVMFSAIHEIKDIEELTEDILTGFASSIRVSEDKTEHPLLQDVINGEAEVVDAET